MDQIIRRIGKQKKSKYYIDNEILVYFSPIIKPHGLAIYNVLAKYANSKTQGCFPSYETIMKESGIGKRATVSKYLKILEKQGLVRIGHSKGNSSNRYLLLDPRIAIQVAEKPKNTVFLATVENEIVKINSGAKIDQAYPSSLLYRNRRGTGSHIIESEKEIIPPTEEEIQKEEDARRIELSKQAESLGVMPLVPPCLI